MQPQVQGSGNYYMYKGGGEDLKSKLQQLREGMGYYDQKINASMLENNRGNNSILLPELKSITPQIHNIKQQQGVINRKKSVEKVGGGYPSMVVDGASPGNGGG